MLGDLFEVGESQVAFLGAEEARGVFAEPSKGAGVDHTGRVLQAGELWEGEARRPQRQLRGAVGRAGPATGWAGARARAGRLPLVSAAKAAHVEGEAVEARGEVVGEVGEGEVSGKPLASRCGWRGPGSGGGLPQASAGDAVEALRQALSLGVSGAAHPRVSCLALVIVVIVVVVCNAGQVSTRTIATRTQVNGS